MEYPAETSDPTKSGPSIPPTLPIAAAIPDPVARITVGYCSGEYAYNAPHAPRLKNDRNIPETNNNVVVSAPPNTNALAAVPSRYVINTNFRPAFSINQAADNNPAIVLVS